jgi:hypothetical protein
MSLQSLKRVANQSDLENEAGPASNAAIFWKKTSGSNSLRIVANPRSEVITDGNVEWTQTFLREYEEVQKSLWQKLRKVEIDDAIFGPNEKEFRPIEDRSEAYLIWSNDPDTQVVEEARKRLIDGADIEAIGRSIAIIRNGIPQALQNSGNYLPTGDSLVTVQKSQESFKRGVGGTFERMYRENIELDKLSSATLRELHSFWQNNVGMATLDGDRIKSLESRKNPKAWVVIVPPDHPLMSHPHSFRVDTSHDLNLLYIKSVDVTPDWYGLVGVHELVHLHDFATGKESKKPSRDEYLEGEVRAFSAEVAAAQLITDGEFLRAIREQIDFKELEPRKLAEMVLGQDKTWIEPLVATIDRHLKLPKSAGEAEASTRAGLYLMSLGFESLAKRDGNPVSTPEQKKKFIEVIYESQGVLPKE